MYAFPAKLQIIKAKKPIIPVYVEKRKNFFKRQRIVIGEPINPIEMCGKMPTLAEMDKISEILRQKENELKQILN